jgi:23S rRNA-/tRNA-specific pseudouridylate synthase
MENNVPVKPKNSARITIELTWPEDRLDNILLEKIRTQEENLKLKNVSRSGLKKLFTEGKIQIKGQNAKPSSSLAKGTTYIDILGY